MTTTCKTWESTKFSYLCGYQLLPTASNNDCSICVYPSVPRGNCPPGTPANCTSPGVLLPNKLWFSNPQMTEENTNGEYTITVPSGYAYSGAVFTYKTVPINILNSNTVLTRDTSFGQNNSPCTWSFRKSCIRWYNLKRDLTILPPVVQIADVCTSPFSNPLSPPYYTVYGGNYSAGWDLKFTTVSSIPKVRLSVYRTYTAYCKYIIGTMPPVQYYYEYTVWPNSMGNIKSPFRPWNGGDMTKCGSYGPYGPGYRNIYGEGNTLGYGGYFAVWEMDYPCNTPLKSTWTLNKVYDANTDTALCSNPGIWPSNIPNTITVNVSL